MRIAQVAPLYESVPPKLYGGTERVISYLTEELVRQGHDVTLFASADSVTNATLRPQCDRALRLEGSRVIDPLAHHIRMLEALAREADAFDIVHFHIDYLHFPVTRRENIVSLTTLHGRLDLTDTLPVYREFPEMSLVSISDSQRIPMPWANWAGTVHHGLPERLFQFHESPGKYLAFLGRISPEKRVDRAIEIANLAGMPLKIAAKVDAADRDYFEIKIRRLLDDPNVEYIGEIGEKEKSDFLGNAHALLFPVDWPEPFGLVMIEALACGTPVIAYDKGSVREILDEGVTGFVVDGIEAAAEAVRKAGSLSRAQCRHVFEAQFGVQRMCAGYLEIYNLLRSQNFDPGVAGSLVRPAA